MEPTSSVSVDWSDIERFRRLGPHRVFPSVGARIECFRWLEPTSSVSFDRSHIECFRLSGPHQSVYVGWSHIVCLRQLERHRMIPSHQSHIARFGQSTQYIYIKRDERSAWTQDVRVSAPLHGLNITSALRASTCDSANKTGTRFELPEASTVRRHGPKRKKRGHAIFWVRPIPPMHTS